MNEQLTGPLTARLAAEIRSRACENLRFLGIELDEQANGSCKPDADIATRDARRAARVLVIATREDLTILRETCRLVSLSRHAAEQKERS